MNGITRPAPAPISAELSAIGISRRAAPAGTGSPARVSGASTMPRRRSSGSAALKQNADYGSAAKLIATPDYVIAGVAILGHPGLEPLQKVIAAVRKCMARDAERKAEWNAQREAAKPVVDGSKILAAFASARTGFLSIPKMRAKLIGTSSRAETSRA